MLRDRIKEARKKLGLTQQEVAERIGVAKSTYTGYETGNSSPDMLRMARIMQVLQVDANYLLQDEMRENNVSDRNKLAPDEVKLLTDFRHLNTDGQQMALSMVESLTLNPTFQKGTIEEAM